MPIKITISGKIWAMRRNAASASTTSVSGELARVRMRRSTGMNTSTTTKRTTTAKASNAASPANACSQGSSFMK